MDEDEQQGKAHNGPEGGGVGQAPGEGCEEQEKREKVCERRIGAMPCVFGFWEQVNTIVRSTVKILEALGRAQRDSRFYIEEPTRLAMTPTKEARCNLHGSIWT